MAVTCVPDFFIVGAPKCGTTALYSYLDGHPDIAMSRLKEPFFWCLDDLDRRSDNRTVVTEPEDYPRLWDDAAEGTVKGEASTGYLRSKVAVPAILGARSDARFIVMLRNPAEMAASFHAQLLHMLQEDVADFETAWRLQEVRSRNERIPRAVVNPPKLQYAQVCALGDQLERFMDLVPESRRMVILFDRFRDDPRSVYLETLAFLGVRDDGRTRFDRVNANQVRRGQRLSRLHRSLPERLGPLYSPLRATARALGIRPSEFLTRATLKEAPRQPLRPEFQAELIAFFRPQVEKIEALLNCDLRHWKGGGRHSPRLAHDSSV